LVGDAFWIGAAKFRISEKDGIGLNPPVTVFPTLDHPAWWLAAFIIGICVGSFLNVVIYRMPLGISVNEPKRSFCPGCKSAIPMSRNIPLISWLALRGRCPDCKGRISFRYFAVELLTGLLFCAVWWVVVGRAGAERVEMAHAVVFPLWFLVSALVALSFIDAEHLIIPLELTISSTVAGVLAALLMPELPDLVAWSSIDPGWKDGLKSSILGGVIGYFGLWAVVLLGKLAFGKTEWKHEDAVAWRLEEPKGEEEPIRFHMGSETVDWWDLFFRKSDKLVIECDTVRINGDEAVPGEVVIREDGVTFADGRHVILEEVKSLEGTAKRAVVPREAMGMGDVHLMGVIGAFFGWFGVFFALLAGSLLAIAAAVLGRVGFGMRLPFGPFLAMGALCWLFGGWKIAEWYLASLR
jgi:leader peptidase (prepilin peptidase)/N-methyltransferase